MRGQKRTALRIVLRPFLSAILTLRYMAASRSGRTAVLFVNDTAGGHCGSFIATRALCTAIEDAGGALIARIKRGAIPLDEHFAASDVVIINGEGTFHDDRRQLRHLYRIACAGKRYGKRVALVNTVLEELPDDINLNTFDYLSVRESFSKHVAREHGFSGPLDVAFDATFAAALPSSREPQSGTREDYILITDSSVKRYSEELHSIAEALRQRGHEVRFIDFATQTASKKRCDKLREDIASARFVVAGRFHAACFALQLQTPLVTLSGNTHKIDALMHDTGLTQFHFSSPDALKEALLTSLEPLSPTTLDSATLRQCRDSVIHSITKALAL